jgi:hypothetical protein
MGWGHSVFQNTKIMRIYTCWKAKLSKIFPIVWPQNCPNKRLPWTHKVQVSNEIQPHKELSIKSPCLHPVFGPAFIPYPLFQWYRQNKEILLNLRMKCWNSAFNAQGSRVIIVIVQVGVKIYVASLEALGKNKYGMKLNLSPKLLEKLIWVKFSFPVSYTFDALLCWNRLFSPFSPPNRGTLRITIVEKKLVTWKNGKGKEKRTRSSNRKGPAP